tara:strand:+ start:3630 stop:3857 length:228 start_codon:yes stop_codon:yes gene_type:complete
MPYLKVKPDTYSLSKEQMFSFGTCQFCGAQDWDMRFFLNVSKKAENQRGKMKNLLARRTCSECKSTTALVKLKVD